MPADPRADHLRRRRLLRCLYQEEVRAAAYGALRRRARSVPLRGLLETFLRMEARAVGRLEEHLEALGVRGRGPLRRVLAALGSGLGWLWGMRGDAAALRRIPGEERRGAQHYGRLTEWPGWEPGERATLDGHRCDQLHQANWAEELLREWPAEDGVRRGA